MTNKSLQQHINDDRNELDNPNTSSQRRRHLEDELDALEKYKDNHPDNDYNPTIIELYCYLNPEKPECRVYGD
tara:strand:- start:4826 stop:5044 length:219 start_codon:yes stop_codon:yes gene_type:complete